MHDSEEFEAQLETALVNRPMIEQAKGILVGARCASPDEAYDELRNVSQAHDVKLHLLAAALVEASSGTRPEDPLLRKIIWQEWADLVPNC